MKKRSIQYARVEIDVLSSPIRETVSRAWEQATTLESVGRAAREVTAEAHGTDRAEELRERAIWLQGVVQHALALVAELQLLAGRLQGLADGRAAVETALADAGAAD